MAVYARSISSDNSTQLGRLKKNLVRALQEDVTPRQRELLPSHPPRLDVLQARAASNRQVPGANLSRGSSCREIPCRRGGRPPEKRGTCSMPPSLTGVSDSRRNFTRFQ